MSNLVIGSGYNLNWNQIAVWAKSLRASGYTDDAILVYFGNPTEDVKTELAKLNISIAYFADLPLNQNICVIRFGAYARLLMTAPKQYDWVLATDISDVVFQKNPMDFLSKTSFNNIDHVASSENLVYGNEPWGQQNLVLSFGNELYEFMMHNTIFNAGVIAARHNRMSDLSELIWQTCQGRQQHVFGGGGPDQAAYNFLLNLPTINRKTHLGLHDEPWACQCGTNLDPRKTDLIQHLQEPAPKFDGENVVTSSGIQYHIVHQYNRVPELKEYFERKYNV